MGLGTQSTGAGRPAEEQHAPEPPVDAATATAGEAEQGTAVPDEVLAAARAVFAARDPDVTVLDLVSDSVLDHPAGAVGEMRALRFATGDCSVEVDVHGLRDLRVDFRARPGGRITVDAERRSGGSAARRYLCVPFLTRVSPGVTSFLVRWPNGEHRPVRTAWVVV